MQQKTSAAVQILMLVEDRAVPTDPRVWPEALAFRDCGFSVSIICPKGTAAHREPYTCLAGVHIYRYDLPRGESWLGYIWEYAVALLRTFLLSLRVWRRHGISVVHAANPPDLFFLIGLFYRLFGKRFVFDQHDLSPDLFRVRFARNTTGITAQVLVMTLLAMERWSYRIAHLVIVTNRSFAVIAMARGRCPTRKLVVVRNGPDPERFRPGAFEPALKRGWRFMLAYVGVMGPQDGVDYALRALGYLVHEIGRGDVGLVIIGDGDQLISLQRLAEDLDIVNHVHFTGWLSHSEVRRYLSAADAGICPDPKNGMNEHLTMVKAMEYLAMAMPIVAFDLDETRVTAEDAGLYAEPNSVQDLAAKIDELVSDEARRVRMGMIARARITSALSWEHSRPILVGAYARLVGLPVEVPASQPTERVAL